MGEIIDEVRAQKFGILQFLGHGIKTLGKTDEFLRQVQMDPHVEIAMGQLVNGFNQIPDGS